MHIEAIKECNMYKNNLYAFLKALLSVYITNDANVIIMQFISMKLNSLYDESMQTKITLNAISNMLVFKVIFFMIILFIIR